MLWAARTAAEAVLHGGARRRVLFWPRDKLRFTTSSAKRIKGDVLMLTEGLNRPER
jgi:hypothetical protein